VLGQALMRALQAPLDGGDVIDGGARAHAATITSRYSLA
jgi:hypothetical protein